MAVDRALSYRGAVPWNDHIVRGPAGTRPVLKSTRHEVQFILELLAQGSSQADLCASFGLAPGDIRACFAYASEFVANRMMQRTEPGAAKVHVSDTQLKAAFYRHVSVARTDADTRPSHLLLLVYAVECGLKRLLLAQRGNKNTKKLDRDDFTHDLDDLLKLLGQAPRFGEVRLDTPEEGVPAQRIHEALRYGRPLSRDSHDKILREIRKVIEYIEDNV